MELAENRWAKELVSMPPQPQIGIIVPLVCGGSF